MKRIASPLAILFSLGVLASIPLVADEPSDAEKVQQEVAEVELKRARLLLSDAILESTADALAIQLDQLTTANGLGIDVAEPDAALRAQLSLGKDEGLSVTSVPEDSIGAKAGLQVHDIVVLVGGQKIGNLADLATQLDAADGRPVKLMLRRAGKPLEIEVTPQKPKFAKLQLQLGNTGELVVSESYRIGVALSEADDTLRQQLRLAAGEGLVVTEVFENSAAAHVLIEVHDVLTVLDGKRLTTVEAINAQIQEIKDRPVELRLLRAGKEQFRKIAPQKTQEHAFLDRPITVWDTRACNRCHADPHATLAERLNANLSVWTDGHHAKVYRHVLDKDHELLWSQRAASAAKSGPHQQIEALKTQLGHMQKTLAALETALQPPPAEKEAPKEEKKE